MTGNTEAVNTAHAFYSALNIGDQATTQSLLSKDITWITVGAWMNPIADELQLLSEFINHSISEYYAKGWSLSMNGRGPQEVLDHLTQKHAHFIPSSVEFNPASGKIIALGSYKGSDTHVDEDEGLRYAHVLSIEDGKISRVMQFFYTFSASPLPLQQTRRPGVVVQ